MYDYKKGPTGKETRLLVAELLVYVKELSSEIGDVYFPTNMLRTRLLNRRGIKHCWKTYQVKLQKLADIGKLDTISTAYGPMWKIKNG